MNGASGGSGGAQTLLSRCCVNAPRQSTRGRRRTRGAGTRSRTAPRSAHRVAGRAGRRGCAAAQRAAAPPHPARPRRDTHLRGHRRQHIHAPAQDGDEIVLGRHDDRRHILRGARRRKAAWPRSRTQPRKQRLRARACGSGSATEGISALCARHRAPRGAFRPQSAPPTPTHIPLDALGHLLPKDLHGRAPRRARVVLLDNHLRGRELERGSGVAASVAAEPASGATLGAELLLLATSGGCLRAESLASRPRPPSPADAHHRSRPL